MSNSPIWKKEGFESRGSMLRFAWVVVGLGVLMCVLGLGTIFWTTGLPRKLAKATIRVEVLRNELRFRENAIDELRSQLDMAPEAREFPAEFSGGSDETSGQGDLEAENATLRKLVSGLEGYLEATDADNMEAWQRVNVLEASVAIYKAAYEMGLPEATDAPQGLGESVQPGTVDGNFEGLGLGIGDVARSHRGAEHTEGEAGPDEVGLLGND